MRFRPRTWVACLFLALVAIVLPARADDEPQAFARVVVDSADLRTGPGVSFRVIYTAHRGETLALDGRPGTGFWLRVILADGRAAYALGDEVQPFAVRPGEEGAPSRPGLFAPPPLEGSRGGLTIVGGVFSSPIQGLGVQQYGYMEARPQIVLHKTISLDGFIGAALTADGPQFLYGGGASVYFAPDWPVCPFLGIGGGGLSLLPTTNSFIKKEEDYFVARAGGGLLLALRGRILMRFAGGFGVYF
jgi:hypothetical protein